MVNLFLPIVGFAFCILSLLCTIALGFFDKRAERIFGRKKNEAREKIHPRDVKEFPGMFWLAVAICVTFYVTIIPFVGIVTYVPIVLCWYNYIKFGGWVLRRYCKNIDLAVQYKIPVNT